MAPGHLILLDMSQDPYKRTVLLSIPRKADLDIHVCRVTVEGVKYVDLREFIPSLEAYGRGILIPQKDAQQIGAQIAAEGEDDAD